MFIIWNGTYISTINNLCGAFSGTFLYPLPNINVYHDQKDASVQG